MQKDGQDKNGAGLGSHEEALPCTIGNVQSTLL